MAQPAIVPIAKSLYLCDGTIGMANQKTDIMGLFNSIRPLNYPHVQKHFVVFAQLLGGLGQIPFYIDVRSATDGSQVHSTTAKLLQFARRDQLIQMAHSIHNCRFPQPGIYLVELICQGQWVADTTIRLI